MSAVAEDIPPVDITVSGDWDADEWDAYALAAGADGHFHAYAWRNILWRALKHRPRYLAARRRGSITGILPLFDVNSRLFGRSLISVPFLNGGGVLASDDVSALTLLRHAHEFMQENGHRYVELRHRQAFPLADNFICRRHKVAMRLALPVDPDQLFADLKAKVRSQVRRPVKAGARAQVINGQNIVDRDIDAFYRVFSENMRDLGTPVFPKALFRETVDAFGGRAWLVIVWLDGHPSAAGLMVGFGPSIEMIWASSLRCFNRLSVNMQLYWEAMHTAIEQGYRLFDFGRCTEGGPTYRFKAQWGAEPAPLHWHYLGNKERIPDVSPANPRFHLAVRAWQNLPVSIANRIGPMIARSLP
ncbi:MAG: FemAB family PEP-CTERM system-associated protein [Alphaproteobacteria bacterium]|nr:FemAB family PEP-CTERM system-associated protein [Alphaproteobacteria bacterium]